MKRYRKVITCMAIVAVTLLQLLAFGCSQKTLLNPNEPVTLTMWHVYGEQADSPMNLWSKNSTAPWVGKRV